MLTKEYIERPSYMQRILPFVDRDVVKVLTGLRRSGKTVMLDLVRRELDARGVPPERILGWNFEDPRNAHLCTAEALHRGILQRAEATNGRLYLFFDEIQEVQEWEKMHQFPAGCAGL